MKFYNLMLFSIIALYISDVHAKAHVDEKQKKADDFINKKAKTLGSSHPKGEIKASKTTKDTKKDKTAVSKTSNTPKKSGTVPTHK